MTARAVEIIRELQEEKRVKAEEKASESVAEQNRQKEIRDNQQEELERLHQDSGIEEQMDSIGKGLLGVKVDGIQTDGEWGISYHNIDVDPNTKQWHLSPSYKPDHASRPWDKPTIELKWRKDYYGTGADVQVTYSIYTDFDIERELVIVRGNKEEIIIRDFQLKYLPDAIPQALARAYLNPAIHSERGPDESFHDYSREDFSA